MVGNAALADARGIGPRRMQKRAAGAPGAIDHVLGEPLEVIRVVVVLVADHIHQPRPAAADADDFVAFAQRAEGDRADRWIQAGDVAASRQDSDHALFYVDVRHVAQVASVWISKTNDYGRTYAFSEGVNRHEITRTSQSKICIAGRITLQSASPRPSRNLPAKRDA